MRNKTLSVAVAAALLTSGAAFAQKAPGTFIEGQGSVSGPIASLPGFTCTDGGGSNCDAAIPDDDAGGLTSTFPIRGCGTILDVDIGIDTTHTFVGDLIYTITSPDATSVTIIDRPGTPPGTFGCGGDDILAILDDDEGVGTAEDSCNNLPALGGVLTPNNPLSAFDGEDADGTWTLVVSDNAGFDTGSMNNWSVDVYTDSCGSPEGDIEPEPAIARFEVVKDFDDDNPASVDVEISCNTGLPISQPGTVDEDGPITFVVTDFNDGELNCEITETAVEGYTAEYDNGDTTSEISCNYEEVAFGDFNTCTITNSLDAVTVEVTKWWLDENPQFNPINFAEANYSCVNEVFDNVSGSLDFLGDGATNSFTVYPDYDGSTTCTVTESFVEGGVESDDSECASLSVTPGNGASCNIYNTRLFEGIPTLSQYGLAIMALLMLGVGFVAFRRIA